MLAGRPEADDTLPMQIHLSKPGGQREGPYTLEQINRALAAGKFKSTEYWAWYEGLPEWIPLHSIAGVADGMPKAASSGDTEIGAFIAPAVSATRPVQPPTQAGPPQGQSAPTPPDSAPAQPEVASHMPFSALDQIFILSTAEGPAAAHAPMTTRMLEEVIGEDIESVRAIVPRDVIGQCKILEGMRGQASVPGDVWRAMAAFKPALLQKARAGDYRICVRTFELQGGELVSIFLFYNKQKL